MYTKINDQQIYFQKLGLGKDLIILHGWGQDVSSFWSVSEKLKGDFTCWLIDLPGFGRSETPQKDFTNADYAKVIKGFIEDQKIQKPHILGHSVGGRITIKLTSLYPEIVEKIILEDAAGIKPKQDAIKPFLYIGAKVFNLIIPNFFKIKQKLRTKFYASLEADYINAGDMKGTLTNLLDEDLTPDLPKIKNDTLLIWGEKDRAVPLLDGKKMYRLIPNSRIEVFDNIGHFPHLENQELFVQFVKDYLS